MNIEDDAPASQAEMYIPYKVMILSKMWTQFKYIFQKELEFQVADAPKILGLAGRYISQNSGILIDPIILVNIAEPKNACMTLFCPLQYDKC